MRSGPRTCALLADHTAWCWGDNGSGQVGVAAGANVTAPVQVLDNVVAIAGGVDHTCAVRGDTTVWCWGGNDDGQLGDGSMTARATPAIVPGVSGSGISAGEYFTCARLVSGDYSCWGVDYNAELGAPPGSGVRATPQPAATPGLGLLAIASEYASSCAIGAAHDVYCWGGGSDGQLGLGFRGDQNEPTMVSVTGTIVGVAVGTHHACAIRDVGTVACWGRDSAGQLGDGMQAVLLPQMVTLPGAATALATGGEHTCAIVGGQVYCWGSDTALELGDGGGGAERESATPIHVTLPSAAATLGLGHDTSCARLTNGDVWCWGSNFVGQLGEGDDLYVSTPVQTMASNVTSITGGNSQTCDVSGSVVSCWGDDTYGQLGDGGGAAQYSPHAITGATFAQVATGYGHVCALSATGHVTCWGLEDEYQCGTGTSVSTVMPTAIDAGTVYSQLAAAEHHTCGVTAAGGLKCWGENGQGELGDGTLNTAMVPTAITISGTATAITTGYEHTCLVSSTGTYCWGDNTYGQLGDGTATLRTTHVTVGVAAVGVYAGSGHSCALTGSGAVLCWGDNACGQVGNGTYSSSLVPVAATIP